MSTTLSTIGRVATFFRGLIFLTPLHLCMVGSSFAMKRFGYKEEAVSIFVAFCGNAMEILEIFATLSTLSVVTILKTLTPRIFTQISSGMSLVVACLTVTINVLLLRLYALDDSVDNVTRYYWLLVLALFSAGVDVTCALTIAPEYISNYDLGVSTSGIVVAGFHWIVLRFIDLYSLDASYWLIVSQLLFMIVISTIAAMLWLWFLPQEKIMHASGVSSSGGAGEGNIRNGTSALSFAIGFGKCLPMVLGTSLAMSTVFAVYPLVAPYQVTPFEYHYPIQRLCLVVDTIASAIVWFLDAYARLQSDWYKYPYAWWHLIWLLFIPYFGIAVLFLRCMHYPESGLPQAVLRRPFVIGCLTVLFNIMACFNHGISMVPIPKNSDGYHEVISPLNMCLSLIAMIITKYMSEAYVQQFKLAKEGVKAGKAWPTDGMSEHSALRYWIRNAATLGYSNFKDLATADVKQRLGSVPRHIASYRGANP